MGCRNRDRGICLLIARSAASASAFAGILLLDVEVRAQLRGNIGRVPGGGLGSLVVGFGGEVVMEEEEEEEEEEEKKGCRWLLVVEV